METKIFSEPHVYEDSTTLVGSGVFPFDNDYGFSHNNTQLSGGSITLVDPLQDGTCTFPAWTPPTFTSWNTSIESATGTVDVEFHTDYDSEDYDLPADMSRVPARGTVITITANIPAGSNSLEHLIITYEMAFATVDDIDEFSYLDEENGQGTKFTDTQKRSAIRYAHSRVQMLLKDWPRFYNAALDVQTRVLLREAETYYALGILYDRKAKLALNSNPGIGRFSVGDMTTEAEEGKSKSFYVNFQTVSQLYMAKANEIMALIVPPGTDSVRTTFFFSTSDGC